MAKAYNEKMKSYRFMWLVTVLLLVAISTKAQENIDSAGINSWYKQHYDFVTMPDTIYTFEGEFTLPDGCRHADSSELTDFQNYVANFPLWHRFIRAGSWKGTIQFDYTEISRTVHLPHYGPIMRDCTIPIRILAEYLHDRNRELEFVVIPNSGDTMIYTKWLFNDIVYGARHSVKYRETAPKDTTLEEYYTFMKFCQDNTTYQSLAYNSDTVKAGDLRPGDLLVAHGEDGKNGVVYVVMHMLVDEKKQKLYAVATGCKEACDFHIPLFNNDRNNPWLTSEQIAALGKDFPRSGFLRLKIR
jgi:hypothetical protein